MNRSKWTYISHKGEKNLITILHSPRLGHFAILMNKKIILLDKKVFGQDSYSFFIDDELCIVDIIIVNNRYQYHFRVDTTAETELNQIRKTKQKKNLLYSLITFSGLFSVVAIVMVIIFTVQDNKIWDSIRDNAVLSVAEIQIVELKESRYHVFYGYRDSLRQVRGIISSYKESNPILANGFPVKNKDQFLVTYSSKVKTSSKLHLNYPTHKTVQRYRKLATTQYLKNNPAVSYQYCDCILDIAYELENWQGYALVYNAQTSTKQHKQFNQNKYQTWLNSAIFLGKEIDCWQYK